MTDKLSVDDDLIRRLADLLEETGLSEIEIGEGEQHLRVARPSPVMAAAPLAIAPATTEAAASPSEAAIDALFRLVLIELCRAAPAGFPQAESGFNPRMEAVRLHLDKHFTDPVRLEELCDLSNLRKANLCRQFKAYTGLSTGDYLKQRRLAAALQKLRTTSDKILTLCHDCGFSDISNFNRAFRSAFGITPSEYRKTTER